MFLYLVTCVADLYLSQETIDVYVVAKDATSATKEALELMKTLDWKFKDRVSNVKTLASVNTYHADKMLIIASED
jgi:hypothetical protein